MCKNVPNMQKTLHVWRNISENYTKMHKNRQIHSKKLEKNKLKNLSKSVNLI